MIIFWEHVLVNWYRYVSHFICHTHQMRKNLNNCFSLPLTSRDLEMNKAVVIAITYCNRYQTINESSPLANYPPDPISTPTWPQSSPQTGHSKHFQSQQIPILPSWPSSLFSLAQPLLQSLPLIVTNHYWNTDKSQLPHHNELSPTTFEIFVMWNMLKNYRFMNYS